MHVSGIRPEILAMQELDGLFIQNALTEYVPMPGTAPAKEEDKNGLI